MTAAPEGIVIQGTEAYAPLPSGGPVVTIGNFDGVHRGHRRLLESTISLAAELGVPSAVLTFDPAPRDVLRPASGVLRIQPLEDKLAHLARAGIDHIVVEPFTRDLAAMEPEPFARLILEERLAVSGLVLGYDFRFGRRRAGTIDDLRRVLAVPIRQVEALFDDDGPVSSSRVRAAVAAGDLATANRLLGRPYELSGLVASGDARGRELGFPTANVVPTGSLHPPYGVYAVRARVGGAWLDGVANWGVRPMWHLEEPLLEVHLLDFTGDLYGQHLTVGFVERLRGEESFDGVEALKVAIAADVAAAREALT